jgi:hypothetical protein
MSDNQWVAIISAFGAVAAAAIAIIIKLIIKPRPWKAFYGRWRWEAEDGVAYLLNLRKDGSFEAEAGHQQWKGTWGVRNRSLFLAATHERTSNGWVQSREVWIDDEEIRVITTRTISFAYGGFFERA